LFAQGVGIAVYIAWTFRRNKQWQTVEYCSAKYKVQIAIISILNTQKKYNCGPNIGAQQYTDSYCIEHIIQWARKVYAERKVYAATLV
jgi:hypothetical protein